MDIDRGRTGHDPGKWYLLFGGYKDTPASAVVVLWCPACKSSMSLHVWNWLWFGEKLDRRELASQSGHTILPDGLVTPSVDCPHCSCPYHENGVRLLGWDAQEVGESR
jgi:hypothetical protein